LPVDPVVARTDTFSLTRSDIDRWAAFLKGERSFQRRLAGSENPEDAIAREAALTAILLAEYPDEVPDIVKRHVWHNLEDAAIRRTYVREVVGPGITIDPGEVRSIYTEHRANYRKSAGVSVLEIYLWAPEDLPELRARKRKLLEDIGNEVSDPQAFRQRAETLSDATNAFRGGSVGTILEDRVGGALREALFSGRTGMTEIVESPEGLFLFWVTRMTPSRDNSFEDVAQVIEKKLRAQRLQELMTKDTQRLRLEHEIEVTPPARDAGPTASVLVIDGQAFSLDEIDLPAFDTHAVGGRAIAMLRKQVLESGGFEIDRPDRMAFDYQIARMVLSRLVQREAAAPESIDDQETAGNLVTGPALERWTFDLLRFEKVEGPAELSVVFRALHRLGPGAGLDDLAADVAEDDGLEGTITHYDDVLASSVAGLGPEIHTTIKKLLQPGDLSKPLHLAGRKEIVVIELEGRRIDEEASKTRAARSKGERDRKEIERRLVDDLIKQYRFLTKRDSVYLRSPQPTVTTLFPGEHCE
jgi:hypothetical protein